MEQRRHQTGIKQIRVGPGAGEHGRMNGIQDGGDDDKEADGAVRRRIVGSTV